MRQIFAGVRFSVHDGRGRGLVATMPAEPTDQLTHTNLAWLLRLRWGAIGGQLLAILVVRFGMAPPLPLSPLLGLVGVEILSNLAWTLRPPGRPVPSWALGAIMALDVLLLSGLLFLT